MADIHEILRNYWGYDSFRPGQRPIIESVLNGNDTLALLPTGGGKSLCYQVPALARDGITLVISPLIALMHDQVEALKDKGISAVALTSDMHHRQLDTALDNAVLGKYKFIYASPERLKTELFIARFKRMNVSLIAVDEAHCVSQWGYDFRPVYLQIPETRELHPDVPIMALTATATPEVADDICDKLDFKRGYKNIKGSFKRDNLSYFIEYTEKKEERLKQILNKNTGTSIIYLRTRKRCRETADYLRRNGYSADYYHAGLTSDKRREIQQKWIDNQIRIICATNAFGMGIDKPDVRTVIHLDLCDDPESYFQEAGRAGRDRKKAFAVTLFHDRDLTELDKRFEMSYPPEKEIKRIYKALGNYFQLATGAGAGRTFELNIERFCNNFNVTAINLFNVLKVLERDGQLELNTNVARSSKFKFRVDNKYLYNFKLKNKIIAPVIDLILRTYDNCFEDYISIYERKMAGRLNAKIQDVVRALDFLNQSEIADYIKQTKNPRVTYLQDRHTDSRYKPDHQAYEMLKRRALERKEAVKKIVTENEVCRSVMLLEYFGEPESEKCGICDVCVREKQRKAREKNVKNYIRKNEGCDIGQIREAMTPYFKRESVIEVLRYLMDESEVTVKDDRYFITDTGKSADTSH